MNDGIAIPEATPSPLDNPVRAIPAHKRLRNIAEPHAVGRGLEVGPFDRPFFTPEEAPVEYLDYRSTAEARAYAALAPGHDPRFVPEVHYVVPPDGSWSLVPDESFDWMVASHVLEHCPNLVAMVNTMGSKMRSGGKLIIMLPDKRHTFDVHRPISTLGQVMEDHLRNAGICRAQAVFDHVFYGQSLHISGAQAVYATQRDNPAGTGDFGQALAMCRASLDKYVDTHNYVFTAQSFKHICDQLCAHQLIPFEPVDFTYTPDDDITFVSILRKR